MGFGNRPYGFPMGRAPYATPATMFSGDDFFWINTARSPVTLDGSGNIELIENLGNFGGDMQQGTASNRPGYGITQLNGKDVIDLDGVSEFLENTLPAGDWSFLHDGTLYSVLTVFKPGNGTDIDIQMRLLSNHGSASTSGAFLAFEDRNSNNAEDRLRHVVLNDGSPGVVVDNQTGNNYVPQNNWHHAEVLADPSNSTAADRSIITADDQGEEKNNSGTQSLNTNNTGGTLNIGRALDDRQFWEGQFSEMIIVKGRHVTQAELDWFRTDWTKREWGL